MVVETKSYGSLPLDIDGAPPNISFVNDASAGGVLRIATPRPHDQEGLLRRSSQGVARERGGSRGRRHSVAALAAVGVTCLLVGTVAVFAGRRHARERRGTAAADGGSEAYLITPASSSQVDPLKMVELRQPEIRESVNGVLDTTFRIMPAYVDVGPISYMTRAYEGVVPGPVLVVKAGDVLRINQVNKLAPDAKQPLVEHSFQLPNTTTIHTHGLHISPSGIEDNVYRMLGAGEEALSEYHVRADHQAGTFYYHPHYHGSSTIQMAGGMSGALIVKDDPETLPPELDGVRDLVLVMQHLNMEEGTFSNYVFASQALRSGLNPAVDYKYTGAPGNFYIVNGQYQPKLTVQPGEVVRLRIINSGVTNYLLVHVPGCHVHTIAADGVYYPSPRHQELGLIVPVGSRKDVLLQCPKEGLYSLDSSRLAKQDQDMINQYIGTHTNIYEGTLLHVHVTGDAVTSSGDIPDKLPAPVPSQSPQFAPLLHLPKDQVNQFDFEFLVGPKTLTFHHHHHPYECAVKVPRAGFQYTWYGVNGHLVSLVKVQRTIKLGDVEEWRISVRRTDGKLEETQHPFHIHVNHVQVVDMSHGQGYDYQIGDWRDTISLPTVSWPDHMEAWVTVRWKANDFTGMAPAHCHIFPHADTGMILTFEIVDADSRTEPEP